MVVMRCSNTPRWIYFLCMTIAIVIMSALLVHGLFFPLPPRYVSVHPSSTVPPMMGFSEDSVMNTGDANALDAFPGVGEVISQRIIDLREPLGGYRIPEDLLLVKGIGPKTLEQIVNALEEPLVILPLLDE